MELRNGLCGGLHSSQYRDYGIKRMLEKHKGLPKKEQIFILSVVGPESKAKNHYSRSYSEGCLRNSSPGAQRSTHGQSCTCKL